MDNQHDYAGFEKRKKILLVEDSEDNQFLIKRFLTKRHFDVDIAADGAAAIAATLENSYDVILMDMQMPVLDGFAATAQLRAQGFKKPILALTAHDAVTAGQRILDAGCDGHLTKPLDFDLLLVEIEKTSRFQV